MAGPLQPVNAGERPDVFVVDRRHFFARRTAAACTTPILPACVHVACVGIAPLVERPLANARAVRPTLVAADELRAARYTAPEFLYPGHAVTVRWIVRAGNSAWRRRAHTAGLGSAARHQR